MSHFGHKSHLRRPEDRRARDLLMKRALVTMLAGASLFWMLFGMLDVSSAAADMTWRGGSASHSAGDDSPGDTDHHCRERWSHESGDRGHCCNPKPGPTPSPTATPR